MAQNILGCLYKDGECTEKDFEKATYWYNKAAENGNEFAQCNLGKCYNSGIGVEKDLEKAIYWFNKSAENGNNIAQYNLECIDYFFY